MPKSNGYSTLRLQWQTFENKNTLCARPLWKSFPVVRSLQATIPPVPMQGCLSAVSIQNLDGNWENQEKKKRIHEETSSW